MKTKAWISRIVAAGGVAVALSLPTAAMAQTAPYPGGQAPQVMGEQLSRVPTQVLGESVSRGGSGLAVTGADIAGMVVLGFGAIGAGTVLVRRSRVRPA